MSATKLEFDSDGSFIEHVTYHVKEKELVVRMREGGKVYHHPGVTRDFYRRFEESESHGNFYNTHIKGQYPHVASKAELKRNEDAFNVLAQIVHKAQRKVGLVTIRDELKTALEIVNRKV